MVVLIAVVNSCHTHSPKEISAPGCS